MALLDHVHRFPHHVLVQHRLAAEGIFRRYADYLPSDGFTTLNTVSTIGSFILGGSLLPFVWNVFKSYRYGKVVTVDDPWGYGNSLEWATSCPPPRHNFTELPRIRSERPAFELHYPHMVERMRAETHVGRRRKPVAVIASTVRNRARSSRAMSENTRRPRTCLARGVVRAAP